MPRLQLAMGLVVVGILLTAHHLANVSKVATIRTRNEPPLGKGAL
jgi:hypothetical protein